jgi:hypothetical protein
MWARMRLSVEIYLDKFDPLSTVTPRGVFCVNKGETDPNRVSLKQNKTRSVTNKQGNKYTKKDIHAHTAPTDKSAGETPLQDFGINISNKLNVYFP